MKSSFHETALVDLVKVCVPTVENISQHMDRSIIDFVTLPKTLRTECCRANRDCGADAYFESFNCIVVVSIIC